MAASGHLTYITRINPDTQQHVPAEGRRKVFISYKKSDNALSGIRDSVASKILYMVDCAVWYDEFLTPGMNYVQEIIDAISECDAMVLLLTRDILQSEFVWDIEVATARKQKKGIIPIAFGIPKEEFAEAERRLGDRLEIMSWPTGSEDGIRFDDAFKRALDRFVVDAELAMRVERFFSSGKHTVSLSQLTPEQKYLMGLGYLRGLGIRQDTKKGIGLLDSIAHLYGDDEESRELKGVAALELDKHYNKTDDYEKSTEYRLIGADAGNVTSIARLAYAYSHGKGVNQDEAKAAELYARSAEMGSADAKYNLGVMYYVGEVVAQDKAKSIELYEKAAQMGHADATFALGAMHSHGDGVEQDKVKAAKLYEKAVKLGNAKAMYNLGVMYYSGEGVEQDKSKAIELYAKATEMGVPEAAFNLAIMYYTGDTVEKDEDEALKLFTMTAEKTGDAEAKRMISLITRANELEKRLSALGTSRPRMMTPKEIRAAKRAEKAAAKAARKEEKAAAKAAKRAARKNK